MQPEDMIKKKQRIDMRWKFFPLKTDSQKLQNNRRGFFFLLHLNLKTQIQDSRMQLRQ